MTKARGKPKSPPAKKTKAQRIEKAELFAYAYIKHGGNGTAAAKEVYELENDASANTRAYELLRNSEVQKIIGDYLDARRAAFKKLIDQAEYYLSGIAETLFEMCKDKELSVHDRYGAMERLGRMMGTELDKDVTKAKVEAKENAAARGRAVLPGVPAPGMQPGQPTGIDNSRKTIFMLSPPPMPAGMKPTPALEEQWRSMGWKPGVVDVEETGQNPGHESARRGPVRGK